MKTKLFLSIVSASVLSLCSCGSSRQPVAGAGDYQYQLYLAQQRAALETGQAGVKAEPTEAQNYAKRPKATLREDNPTVELALAECEHLRMFGDATGFVESAVMDHAIMVAQERMAALLKSELTSGAKNYTRNANVNLDNTGAELFENVSQRLVINASKNARLLKRSVYDLDNGQVQIFVCIEVRPDNKALAKQLANELSREGFLGLQFDRDRFAAETEASLMEYRQRLKDEAAEGE